MTVNRTTLLDLPLPVTGTESGTWGDTTNNGLTQYLDIAIAGTLVLSTDADVTLTSTEGDSSATNIGATTAQYAILRWTATGSTTRNITALAQSKTYVVINATGGTQSIVLRGAGPTTGVTIISGEKALCVWNGSDFVKVSSSAAAGGSNTQVQYNSSGVLAGSSNMTFNGTSLTLGGNPTLSAGTANGVLYLNGSKVATSGSALAFDGTNFSTTGTATATKLVPTGNVTAGNGMYLPATNTLAWSNNGAETMRLDSSGNLGLGVTPSAWGTYKALQVGGAGYGLMGGTSGTVFGSLVTNAYYDGTNWKYVNNAYAQRYDTASGEHRWFNAPSGTAGNTITFTQAMTLDSSGRLLFGTTTTTNNIRLDEKVAIVGANVAFNGMALTGYTGAGSNSYRPLLDFNRSRGTTDGSMTVLANGDYLGSIVFRGSDGTSFQDSAMISAEVDGTPGASDMPGRLTFWTVPDGSASVTERARITSGGDLLVGTTAQISGSSSRLVLDYATADYVSTLRNSNASPYGLLIRYSTDTNNSTNYFITAIGDATSRFVVASNGNVTNTNNSYGAISDVKLKENIADATPKLNDLLQVRVVNYNLKSQPDQKHIGVIAQELEQVFPGLIEESQDRDTDGELTGETIKSVKYSVFVPMLIKAMQEQQALITALTARVALLEGN